MLRSSTTGVVSDSRVSAVDQLERHRRPSKYSDDRPGGFLVANPNGLEPLWVFFDIC